MILGINFGHDGSLAFFDPLSNKFGFLELERISRLKHHVGITLDDIKNFLRQHEISIESISSIAFSGTQFYSARYSGFDINEAKCKSTYNGGFSSTKNWYGFKNHRERLKNIQYVDFPDNLYDNLRLGSGRLGEVTGVLCEASDFEINSILYQYEVVICGRKIPAFFVPHHYCHAWYAACHDSVTDGDLIISHDGGWPHLPFNSGGVFRYHEGLVAPIFDARFFIGQLYQQLGEEAGFHAAEAPGKLMGLASYATVRDEQKAFDCLAPLLSWRETASNQVEDFEVALRSVINSAREFPISDIIFRSTEEFFDPPISNLRSIATAALAQFWAEELWVKDVSKIVNDMKCHASKPLGAIHIVGGFSLNCPANTRLRSEIAPIRDVVYPAGSDMGLCVGAVAAVASRQHNRGPSIKFLDAAFLALSPDTLPARDKYVALESEGLTYCRKIDYNLEVENLLNGCVYCIFDGPAEIGPRALGHRSIVAVASDKNLRDKINRHKGREDWRPLAPMVLSEDFDEFFEGSQVGSEHMLRTHKVKKPLAIPAVTHVDGTARVQVVNNRAGHCFEFLKTLRSMGATPILINTSFNCAGEPLVETIEGAVKSFLKLELDFLIVGECVYRREVGNG